MGGSDKMIVFVTGGSGFIGKRLMRQAAATRGRARSSPFCSTAMLASARTTARGLGRRRMSAFAPSPATSSKPTSASAPKTRSFSAARVDHFFHLAAVYDLAADPKLVAAANVEGVAQRARLRRSDRGRHVPSRHLDRRRRALRRNVSAKTCSRRRATSTTPISRPSTTAKVSCAPTRPCRGASTGRASWSATRAPAKWTRSTAPTTSSSSSRNCATFCPPWFPLIGLEGGRLNVVPVDFVVAALDHLAFLDGHDGETFHLTDPSPMRVGEMLNLFAHAGHAPDVHHARQRRAVRPRPARLDARAHGADAVQAHTQDGDAGVRPARRRSQLPQLSHPLRQPAHPELLRPARNRRPAARKLRLAPLGLLGASSRPGAVRRQVARAAPCAASACW